MTEAEWLACDDSRKRLLGIPDQVSDRKLRLLAVGFCRQAAHFLPNDPAHPFLEVAE